MSNTSTKIQINPGDQVVFKREWRDEGDDSRRFIALEEPHPVTGAFRFRDESEAAKKTFPLVLPQETGYLNQVEHVIKP